MKDPPSGAYISISERLVNIVRSLTLTNILMIALLVVIAVPAYFAYRFMTDEAFRRDFGTHAAVLEKNVVCDVFEGQTYGAKTHQSVLIIFGVDGRLEKVVGVRALGKLTDQEIDAACQKVQAMVEKLNQP